MNIYLHELKAYGKNTVIWILSLSAGTLFLFSMYPAFAGNSAAIGGALKNFPMMIQLAFGLFIDQIGSVNGFYSFIVTFLALLGALQAMTLGISVIAKETTGKTADFLLTKPVARSRVAAEKLLAVLTCILLTSVVYIAVAFAAASAVKTTPFDGRPFLLMSLSFFFVQAIFLALGFLVATVVPKIRSVLPVALSCVFALFAMGAVAAMLEQEALYYLSPFKYFETYRILMTSSYKPSFALAAALLTAGCVIAGFVIYIRRDVHAA